MDRCALSHLPPTIPIPVKANKSMTDQGFILLPVSMLRVGEHKIIAVISIRDPCAACVDESGWVGGGCF